MSYDYQKERPYVFTEAGQVDFLKVRDHAAKLLEQAGAVSCGKLINHVSGDSWKALACVDRLVELGELREVTRSNDVWAQHRVFVKGRQ